MSKINAWMGYSLGTVVLVAGFTVARPESAIASTFSIKAIASQIAKKTDVPILLPSEDIVEKYKFDNNETIYALVDTKSQYDEYDYTVSFHKHPGGGNATLRFSIKAKKDGNINRTSPDEKATFKNIQLFDGSNALLIQQYGAACWSWLQWKSNGVLYEVWSKTRTPETAIAIANSAIKTSPRQFNTASNTTDKSCITWSRYIKDLPTEGGRGGQWWKYGQFPAKFQQGCVALDDGNTIDRAWILQSGLDIKPYSQPSSQSSQKLPIPTNSNALDRLVNQGKAVLVTWLTPTNGSLQYLRSIPKDRPFLRDDGMTCLNTVCLKSAALSHRELSQILSPGIANSPQPSSPSNQTANTPAASTPSSVALTIESEAIRIGSQNRKTLLKCTEEKPCVEDQIVIDRYQEVFDKAGKIQNVKLALYNTSFAPAAVEVYSSTGKQKTLEYIDGTKPGFKDWEDLLKTTTAGLLEPFRCVGSGWVQCWNQFKYNKYGVERKELTLQLDPGDVIRISRSSDAALAYTAVNTFIDVVELAGFAKENLRTGKQGIPLPLANTQYSPRLRKEIVKGFLRKEIGGKYTWEMLRDEFIKDACRKSCSNPSKLLDISLDILKNIPDEFWKKTTDGSIAARAAGDGLDALIDSVGGSSSKIVNLAFFLSQSANIDAKRRASSVASQKPRHIVIAGFDQNQ